MAIVQKNTCSALIIWELPTFSSNSKMGSWSCSWSSLLGPLNAQDVCLQGYGSTAPSWEMSFFCPWKAESDKWCHKGLGQATGPEARLLGRPCREVQTTCLAVAA